MEETIFSTRIKELREEKGLNKTQLAKELGLSHVTIVEWETGKKTPSVDSVVLLAKFFGVETDFLLGLKDY